MFSMTPFVESTRSNREAICIATIRKYGEPGCWWSSIDACYSTTKQFSSMWCFQSEHHICISLVKRDWKLSLAFICWHHTFFFPASITTTKYGNFNAFIIFSFLLVLYSRIKHLFKL